MIDEDYDASELWKAHAARSKEKRQMNRAGSTRMLESYKIPFVSRNEGAHLLITYDQPQVTIHFYPGTGLWSVQNTHIKKRGVRNLINYIRQFATLESD